MCQKVRVWWISVYAFELMYYVVYSVTKYYPPETTNYLMPGYKNWFVGD